MGRIGLLVFCSMLNCVFYFAACGTANVGKKGRGADAIHEANEPHKIAGKYSTPSDRDIIDSNPSAPLPKGYNLAWQENAGQSKVSPISLTASDETGLKLVSVDAKGVLQDPLAFTELHIVFKNPESRVLEGRFEIALPPGAAVSRFAMKIDQKWQEAEVVERQAARKAYEDFLHKSQDPALLEKKAGNQFRARVFPIPANGTKEFIISYSQTLKSNTTPYLIPIGGLPTLDKLQVDVAVNVVNNLNKSSAGSSDNTKPISVYHLGLNKVNFTPDKDLEVVFPRDNRAVALRDNELVVVRATPQISTQQVPLNKVTVLFDTSASRAMGFDRQVDRLGSIMLALGELSNRDFLLKVVCFDQQVEKLYDGNVKGFDESALSHIKKRKPLGASDIEGALNWVEKNTTLGERIILFTDGIVTAGETESGELEKTVRLLGQKGISRLDIVVDGGIRNEELLRALVNAGLKNTGVVVDANSKLSVIGKKIISATMSDITVSIAGANWVWPNKFDGVQPGDSLLVFAEIPNAHDVGLHMNINRLQYRKASVFPVPRHLLERAAVGAQLERMTLNLGRIENKKKRLREQQKIIDLSLTHRVVSDFTALLVLETEDDYRRFNIDRNALANILTVGPNGLEIVDRKLSTTENLSKATTDKALIATDKASKTANATTGKNISQEKKKIVVERFDMAEQSDSFRFKEGNNAPGGMPPMSPEPSPQVLDTEEAVGETFGYGGLELRGTSRGGGGTGQGAIGLGNLNTIGYGGGGGSGSGYGRGASGRAGQRARAPRIRSGAARVKGALSKEIIRRIIHRHINEIKHCYERQLSRWPDLGGRVAIKFVINDKGQVQMATVARSTLGNANVENCMAQSARRWRFPEPKGGGIVVVNYPFVLSPGSYAGSVQQPVHERSQRQYVPPAEKPKPENAYRGQFAEIINLIRNKRESHALAKAWLWREEKLGDILAIVALGEAAEANKKYALAARIYGSIIDLFPSRADMRRMAGERLERLNGRALSLVIDTYKTAVKQRPDHPSSHRLYAFALLKAHKPKEAFMALATGLDNEYPGGRFAGVRQLMKEDLGLLGAAWLKKMPMERKKILSELKIRNAALATTPSTRFVLLWESDANDVDLHVYDGKGGHAFYSRPTLPSGGHLIADVTTGYGPECLSIDKKALAYPYKIQAHYYNRGPMGFGMGKLQIIEHNGQGGFAFRETPYVIMVNDAYVNLDILSKPSKI